MPYGSSDEYRGGVEESDFVFSQIIKAGIEAAGKYLDKQIICRREVVRSVPGTITASIVRVLSESDVVIADLTGGNPNIFLQLGMRYALRKRGTLMLCQRGGLIPFDISNYRYLSYDSFNPGEAISKLIAFIKETQKATWVDSPVYDVIPSLEVNADVSIHADVLAKAGTLSCFISYSNEDEQFAKKLYADLQGNGVTCWYAPEDIKGGSKIDDQINEAISRHDKLLLILSDQSMNSNWVAEEIRRTRRRERLEGTKMLFPIRLVSFEAIKAWRLFDAEEARDLAALVREYYIPDFSNWTDSAVYEETFDRLLKDLKAVR